MRGTNKFQLKRNELDEEKTFNNFFSSPDIFQNERIRTKTFSSSSNCFSNSNKFLAFKKVLERMRHKLLTAATN